MSRGKLVVFSGTEGSGKKTCFNTLKDMFRRDGSFLFISEFSGCERAGAVHAFARYGELTPFEQFHIYLATRSIFFRKAVLPAIDTGINVICNKSAEMTWAKQVFALNKKEEYGDLFWQCLREMMHGTSADLYIDFHLDPKVALLRHHGIEEEDDELDEVEVSFNRKVREGIDDFFSRVRANVMPVDSMKPPVVLHQEVKSLIQNFVSK